MAKRAGMIRATVWLLLATVSAYGRPTERHVIIPFDFIVGPHMFPSGEYRLRTVGSRMVRIEALRGIAAVSVPTDATPQSSSKLTLLFDGQGSTRKLVGVYGGGEIVERLAANPSKSLTLVTAWMSPNRNTRTTLTRLVPAQRAKSSD